MCRAVWPHDQNLEPLLYNMKRCTCAVINLSAKAWSNLFYKTFLQTNLTNQPNNALHHDLYLEEISLFTKALSYAQLLINSFPT